MFFENSWKFPNLKAKITSYLIIVMKESIFNKVATTSFQINCFTQEFVIFSNTYFKEHFLMAFSEDGK